jgi:hypothetical protein
MVELEWKGSVWRGVAVDGLGVLISDEGHTYAGGVTGGVFDGRGVINWSHGGTSYCELTAGVEHGYTEDHYPGGTVDYFQYERGEEVHSVQVHASGRCDYDREFCGADHAGLVALKAAVQQTAVRPSPNPRRSPLAVRPRHRGVLCASCVCACRSPPLPSRTGDAALCVRACVCLCAHARVRTRAFLCALVRGVISGLDLRVPSWLLAIVFGRVRCVHKATAQQAAVHRAPAPRSPRSAPSNRAAFGDWARERRGPPFPSRMSFASFAPSLAPSPAPPLRSACVHVCFPDSHRIPRHCWLGSHSAPVAGARASRRRRRRRRGRGALAASRCLCAAHTPKFRCRCCRATPCACGCAPLALYSRA